MIADKQSLIDSITIAFAEDFNTNIKLTRSRLTELMKNYRVHAEDFPEGSTDTNYLMNKFIEGKRASGMGENSLRQYRMAIKKLESCTGHAMAEVTSDDIRNFFITYGKEVSSVTLRCKYQLLNSVYGYLYQRKFINFNPMTAIDPPKMKIIYKKQITDLDIEKLKNIICNKLPHKQSVRDIALMYFMVSTGCRISEALSVKIGDIDYEKKCCKVLGKGRKERYVVLTDVCIYRLRQYLETRTNTDINSSLFTSVKGDESGLSTRAVEKEVKKICSLAGISELTCHSFRRYYATELRKRNVSIQIIAKSLGHANLNQINRYSLFTDDEMLNEIRHSL